MRLEDQYIDKLNIIKELFPEVDRMAMSYNAKIKEGDFGGITFGFIVNNDGLEVAFAGAFEKFKFLVTELVSEVLEKEMDYFFERDGSYGKMIIDFTKRELFAKNSMFPRGILLGF